ncbi:MAG: bifunctional diaminohydroxyphosphoribosylaminopyrimidine deaminase/5-amino-6-(5-phosphoribosylamino)uracil reductase RibD [Acidobacteriota bacterium]|jgi:diaminohydroxyphosphoribosylaminopyrimidine deaminase/5-amino-6-(5-phosphoribosylamino)uracil reductase|nr:bifunctional diaminohydroxyphosphoribosylaminopyrimidine deaminase/5-amino-6-(5-phosphoribosylamino)uracil reductase RibD [Acidobacteriota bacterium]
MFDADDRRFMRQALRLAEKGLGLASPNPSVGCVVVKDGAVVGRGWHEYARKDHAEVVALAKAGGAARGATAYVTLEPCSHQGRTGPCADRLVQAGVRRVVAAVGDPNPKVAGRGFEKLRRAGVIVDVGLDADAAGKVVEGFACHVTTGLPLVVAKAGMSLDGKIGTGFPEGKAISSPAGREFGQLLRLGADAILVGVETVLADDPALTWRGRLPKGRPLLRVVLDSALRTPPAARLFARRADGGGDGIEAPVLLFCAAGAPAERQAALEAAGAEVVAVSGRGGELKLPEVLKELGRRNVLSVLVEGGSRIHGSFLARNLVDVFYFIVSPIVLGGAGAVPVVGGRGYEATATAPRFRMRGRWQVGDDMVLEAYPATSRSIVSPWLDE